jgi:hypothetical protein
VIIIGARIIRMSAAIHIRTLHVSAMPSGVHDPRSVMRADDRASAVDSTFNVHPVTIN